MPPNMAGIDLLFLLPLFFLHAGSNPINCYLPNGEVTTLQSPCWDANQGASGLCCLTGDQCLNNTLCQVTGTIDVYRGSCLSSTWSIPECPKFCVEPPYTSKASWPVKRCVDQQRQQWHCGTLNSDAGDATCELDGDPDHVFMVSDNFTAYGTAVAQLPQSETTATTTFTASNPVSSDGGASTSSPTQLPLTGSSGTNTAGTTTTTAPNSNTAGQPSPTAEATDPQQNNDNDKSSTAVRLGVGVGIGSSILIAATVLGVLYLRRRRRQAPVRAETPPPFAFTGPSASDQAPTWPDPLGGVRGTKAPEMNLMHHGVHVQAYTPELGGVPRFELP